MCAHHESDSGLLESIYDSADRSGAAPDKLGMLIGGSYFHCRPDRHPEHTRNCHYNEGAQRNNTTSHRPGALLQFIHMCHTIVADM